ncbi:hypothetical protein Halha_2061 [Halobacteroides halobius DSM 5150]|uniref:DUF4258 domain-containing protein n=1 Tax=Halobacteroides halobius (strain ATCC 35273 / DSM 5150 / MD-1) TaxID=748449 RepID=L0KBN3_HALHC|nr:DUF4258 domain-containing protein [Halobacteroides halobius]AGB41955.1 hypothetical protein Halha_2061 [Halobacteroides halobius DSM 5150]
MLLSEFMLNGKCFRVEGTTHALERMKEREVDEELVAAIVLSLDHKLLEYNNTGEEVAIIDQEHNLAIIIEVREFKAVVITVINKANIHIKDGTKLEEIA